MDKKQTPVFILIGVLIIALVLTIFAAIVKPEKEPPHDGVVNEGQSGWNTPGNPGSTEIDTEEIDDPIGGAVTENPDISEYDPLEATEFPDKWEEGVISYKGKNYLYNTKIKTYLFMGIDKNGPVAPAKDYLSGGQSDAMFLLVANAEDQTLSVISIHRNCMTKVTACNRTGQVIGDYRAQICLQHGYGDGKRLSCVRAVDAVSYMFRNQKINGYFSLNMGGIPAMNDGIGGVELTVLSDLSYPGNNVELKKGDKVKLNGQEAYIYLRGRDLNAFDSASDRLRRQEQYISAYIDKLNQTVAGHADRALELYNGIADYVVTNIDFADIVDELSTYEYNSSRLYSVPGKAVMGETYEEYIIDTEAFYELILKVFYNQVD